MTPGPRRFWQAASDVPLWLYWRLGDAFNGMKNFFNFYNPTGPLSGVTTLAIVVWLAAWFLLAGKGDGRDVALTRVSVVAFALLATGFGLTFPPFMDLVKGK